MLPKQRRFQLGEWEWAVVKVIRIIDRSLNIELFEKILCLLPLQPRHFGWFLLAKNPRVKIFTEDWVSERGFSHRR
jgi:hypothetical protein